MKKTNYSPGDVVQWGDKWRAMWVSRCLNPRHGSGPHWHISDGSWNPAISQIREIRPLVVLDPEDRDQIERLLVGWPGPEPRPIDDVGKWQAALREFANPTPQLPDEPPAWSVVVVAEETPFTRLAGAHITAPYDHCWFGEHPETGAQVRLTWKDLHDLGTVQQVGMGMPECWT